MSQPEFPRQKIFVSYSHKDAKWLERLRPYLDDLERGGSIEIWDDTRIKAGDDWRRELRAAVNDATAAVLLVSQDFLASRFIRENELPPLLEAAEKRGCRILPVVVSPCRFLQTESISRFQAVNDPEKPLTRWGGHYREVFMKLVREIEAPQQNPPSPFMALGSQSQGVLALPSAEIEHFDVYLAIPMSSIEATEYELMRASAERLLDLFHARCGLTVYCAALVVAQPRRFSRARIAAFAWDILDKCKFFVMIYPSEIASSVLVEAGYALHRKIPSVYLVKQGVKLPFMLDASNKLEFVEILDYVDPTEIPDLMMEDCQDFLGLKPI